MDTNINLDNQEAFESYWAKQLPIGTTDCFFYNTYLHLSHLIGLKKCSSTHLDGRIIFSLNAAFTLQRAIFCIL